MKRLVNLYMQVVNVLSTFIKDISSLGDFGIGDGNTDKCYWHMIGRTGFEYETDLDRFECK